MNLLHITDVHFGPYHWAVDDDLVLERLNAFNADIVLNTGDMTSDSLQVEFQQMHAFLSKLRCPNVVSILGNHDKYSKRSHEMFREYIYDGQFIQPKDKSKIKKDKVFFSPVNMRLTDYFTEVNFLRKFEVNGETVLFVCVDTTLFQNDEGFVEEQILASLKEEVANTKHDRLLMLTHHPILDSDEDPLINTKRMTDFALDIGIEATFCGHTHELEMVELSNIIEGKSFRQFMIGSLSSVNIHRESNMFCTYENFGTPDEVITVIRMLPTENGVEFVETIVGR